MFSWKDGVIEKDLEILKALEKLLFNTVVKWFDANREQIANLLHVNLL